jgi:hypothetical protein
MGQTPGNDGRTPAVPALERPKLCQVGDGSIPHDAGMPSAGPCARCDAAVEALIALRAQQIGWGRLEAANGVDAALAAVRRVQR